MQELIKRHEDFKAKGYKLNEGDLFEWVKLWDELLDMRVEKRSEYAEKKQHLKLKEGQRKIELKNMLDDNGKKIHTESTADAQILEELFDEFVGLDILKSETEAIESKIQTIPEYINCAKMRIKK